jgi:hypothetical protein
MIRRRILKIVRSTQTRHIAVATGLSEINGNDLNSIICDFHKKVNELATNSENKKIGTSVEEVTDIEVT